MEYHIYIYIYYTHIVTTNIMDYLMVVNRILFMISGMTASRHVQTRVKFPGHLRLEDEGSKMKLSLNWWLRACRGASSSTVDNCRGNHIPI